eukprot:TRINITY_DN12728_c0_g3_i3.p1 TRINITY_DN12728_c0_g3~~TRINITY_DN12728_c0_g3_i3.p1  ORF type:complete len:360 (+),score=52.37 TRINITY_DN12728_c0_g3_i3:72-1151(+)
MCIRDRYMGAPKVEGFPFIESYQLKILAGISKFKGCEFCKKEDTANSENEEFAKAQRHFREIIADYDRRGIGTWWNEQRLTTLRNTEIELERIPARRYEYGWEEFQKRVGLSATLFKLKYVAVDALLPIVYRYFLVSIVMICLGTLLIILRESGFEWLLKGFAIIDLFLLVIMLLFESKTIQLFTSRNAPKAGKTILFTRLALYIDTVVQILHLATAIIVSVLATREKYKEERATVILYIVTAFVHDIYHYLAKVLVCLYMLVIVAWRAVEYFVKCKGCAEPCIGLLGKCMDEELKMCHMCKDYMAKGESLVYLSCDEGHVFHKGCLTDICREVECCPLCKEPYKFVTGIGSTHIVVKK